MSQSQRIYKTKWDRAAAWDLQRRISKIDVADLCQCQSCRDERGRGIGLPADLAKRLADDLRDDLLIPEF